MPNFDFKGLFGGDGKLNWPKINLGGKFNLDFLKGLGLPGGFKLPSLKIPGLKLPIIKPPCVPILGGAINAIGGLFGAKKIVPDNCGPKLPKIDLGLNGGLGLLDLLAKVYLY